MKNSIHSAHIHQQILKSAESGDLNCAINLTKSWVASDPNTAEGHKLLAILLRMSGNLTESLTSALSAYKISPESPEINEVLGVIYQEQDDLAKAYAHLNNAYLKKPDDSQVMLNLANTAKRLGKLDDALGLYDKIISMNPEHSDAHYNRSLVHLLQKNYTEAWKDYEWRFYTHPPVATMKSKALQWQGQCLQNKSLLVTQEQGLGDTLLHMSLLSELIKEGAKISMAVESRIIPIGQRSFPDINWIDRDAEQHYAYDYSISAGSLMSFYRNNTDDFTGGHAYLKASTIKSASLRKKYQKITGKKKLVGLSWRTVHPRYQSHSIPLKSFLPLFANEDIAFINLQYNQCQDEISELQQSFPFELLTDNDISPLRDLDYFAAQVAALDCVVSIDNSTLPLAGALGVPTLALLPLVPNPFWGIEPESTYWYEHLTLLRQTDHGNWQDVILEVNKRLEDL